MSTFADSNGAGVAVDNRNGADVSLKIDTSIVEGARGTGIVAHGGAVTITQSVVRGTRVPVLGEDSCGVCVRPSGVVPMTAGSDGTSYWDARASTRSHLTIGRALIEDNAGAGISVVGADADVVGTVVRNTG